MIVRRTTHRKWKVVAFEREHNHELLKKFSLSKYLNSHRSIPKEEVDFIKMLHGCTLKSSCAYQIMSELYGGEENVPYTQCDYKNLRKEYLVENRGKDMAATLRYFAQLQKEDPDFFYDYTLVMMRTVLSTFSGLMAQPGGCSLCIVTFCHLTPLVAPICSICHLRHS
uniref:Protein FAR1-RELATED SEQUENCE n=1 Tax=Arundo donax TaxID=35708 RepID=A0A0A8ZA19_ARUDO